MGIFSPLIIAGSFAIATLGMALIPFTYALSQLQGVGMENIIGVAEALAIFATEAAVMGIFSPLIILGSAAIASLGIALIPFTFALSQLQGVGIKNVIGVAEALAIFATEAAVMGIFSGLIIAGSVAMLALGGALMVFTFALNAISTEGLKGMELINKLTEIDSSKLEGIGKALISVGEGLMSLSFGGLATSIFGGDSIGQIERLAKSSDGLMKVASSLQTIASSLSQLSSALDKLDASKLQNLEKLSKIEFKISGTENINSSPVATSTGAVSPSTGIVTNTNKTEAPQSNIDLTPLITAMNEVKSAIDKLYNKNSTINMDGSKVGTTLTQGSYRVA
jgi:hypothetical protein